MVPGVTLFQWAITIGGIVVAVAVLRAFWSRDQYGSGASGASGESGGSFLDGSGDGDSGGDGGGGD